MTGNTMHTRRALFCATAVLACSILAACGGDDGIAGPTGGPVAPTAPSPALDILGWDSWPGASTPSVIQFRWNAAIGKYEVLAPAHADWGRLDALEDLQFGGPPHKYDVFGSGGTKLPFFMLVRAALGYVGWAQIHESNFPHTYFAFGIATAPGDVPVSGTMTCSFGEDEIGEGGLTFDRAAGTVSGWAEPFWGGGVRHQLVQTSFAPGATTFAATFGTDGVLEGRFFGPRAVNVAVRAKGGVSGIMTGVCQG